MNIGILGTSEIAFRRFLPAVKTIRDIASIGIASRDVSKTKKFTESFGCNPYQSYDDLLSDPLIEAVYIPLPPALHFSWAKKALLSGKHVFLEKPSTTAYKDTEELIHIAESQKLVLHENYMFLYHSQLDFIQKLLLEKVIGDLRLITIRFGFPKRGTSDFRYNKELGGGALLDCGGYTIRLATVLSGKTLGLISANLCFDDLAVDLYGSASLKNEKGLSVQIAFGMDNFYKCELEIWGSNGCITAPRIFTAPPDFEPLITILTNEKSETVTLPPNDQFAGSIKKFISAVNDNIERKQLYSDLLFQSKLVDEVSNFK